MVLSYLYNEGVYKTDGKGFIPSPVHRLDINTSGVVVFAKNLLTSQTLMEVFKIHENVSKSYLLLACGKVDENDLNISKSKCIETSSFAVIHAIDDVLLYDSAQLEAYKTRVAQLQEKFKKK
jgi:23S rRNA pseudouridine955/2504/2580 synthase